MKQLVTPTLMAAFILSSTSVIAADPPSSSMSDSSMSHSDMMKSCMAKQKAKDSSMSKDDMKKACMAEMKGTSSMGTGSTPNQTTPTTKGSPDPATAAPAPK